MSVLDRIEVIESDITRLEVDAVVNAANTTLLGGGGVDGAIHRAAGPELLVACRRLGGCPTGEARITPGFRLKAGWVIHTVGPVWRGGDHHEVELLARCYQSSLQLARENGLRTIAFPSISTGAYGFPLARATEIALAEVTSDLTEHREIDRVIFACFGPAALEEYQRRLSDFRSRMSDCVDRLVNLQSEICNRPHSAPTFNSRKP